MKRRGLTIIDLLVTLGVMALLLAALVAARHRLAQADAITDCRANLAQIYRALSAYAATNAGGFPRTRVDPAAPLSAYTAPDASNPFAPDGPSPNDVTAAAFLLAREYGLAAATFVCPSALRNGLGEKDTFTPDTVRARSNFRARIYYNYSLIYVYAEPFSGPGAFDRAAAAKLAIAADTNPGEETANPATGRTNIQARLANSPNHQRDGQNVLLADGSARFVPTPYHISGDASVYASAATFPAAASASDAVLVPVWGDGPQLIPRAVKLRRWVFAGAAVFAALLIGGAVAQSLWRGRDERDKVPTTAAL
ncbi:MAG TPA: hypothetical protein VF624_16500 [Tepidisphaeraceae bacterium]|jgi:Tfp pilus assembly protein PilE